MFEVFFNFSGATLGGTLFDYKLNAGDRLCLRGANGCGKTSLLSQLAGLAHHPEQSDISRSYRGNFHFIGHRTGVHPALSIAEEWQFWHSMLAVEKRHEPCAIEDIAHKVGLGGMSQRIIATLSAGQKQKVALARLFLDARPIWLLDEPDHHLDDHSRAALEDWMQHHCSKGGIVIDASHFPPSFGTVFSV